MVRLLVFACLATRALAGESFQEPSPAASDAPIPVGKDGKYTLVSEGIRAQFIPYGASLTNLFINDTNGIERDIVLGYDNATWYTQDKSHPHLGGVPGRYANRIKNSTFTIDGVTSHVSPNENGGKDTLHGGSNGWDYRNFTVAKLTRSTIVFRIDDPDGAEGFPGAVTSYITYWLSPYTWNIQMNATATKTTPVMLTSHVYWNLDGFQNPNTNTALNHSLFLPFSGMRVEVDNILIPTGNIVPNLPNGANDFWLGPKQIGADFGYSDLMGNCGADCEGYDNCYLVNRQQFGPGYFSPLSDGTAWWTAEPVASLYSDWSGIQVDIYSDQDAFQMYSCNGQNGTMPIKETQGFTGSSPKFPRVVPKYGCVVMEVQDWIDGINNPSWMRDQKQFAGPKVGNYYLEAMYSFHARQKTPENAPKPARS